jgi:cathepsin A (carboxypeptidase C)
MATNLPRCMNLAQVCYDNPDPAICLAAATICWDGVIHYYDGESSYKGGRNRFDITAPCEIEEFCYIGVAMIQKYLNMPKVFKALGVPAAVGKYKVYSDTVAEAFGNAGDEGLSTAPQVHYLLESGINVLIYQGILDLACNTAGNLKWANAFQWQGQPEFASKDLLDWSSDGSKSGTFKEVKIQIPGNDEKSRFTFLTVTGAGHMVSILIDITSVSC